MKLLKSFFQNMANKAKFANIAAYECIDGFLQPNEAFTLYKTARNLPPDSVIVEIGSWKGKSTYCLAKGLKSGKVCAIDPFDASGDAASASIYHQKKDKEPLIQQFKDNMEKLGVLDKIEILQGFSNDFVGKIPQIDFLFIDGDHSKEGCEFDFLSYAPYVKPGGYIALHDFYADRKDLGPTWVVENIIIPSKEYNFFGLFDSLWICQKL
jgi:predicted O-methyltransferase YrrM